MKQSKKVYLECLRVMAILGVIYCHTSSRGLTLYEVTDHAFEHYFSETALLFSQVCVPIFFMISGALLLSREETLRHHLLHRVLKFFLIACAAITMQYLYNCMGDPALRIWDPAAEAEKFVPVFSLKELLKMVYATGAFYQHWFLFAYLSFLLLLPFLQRLVKGLKDDSLFWYFVILYLIYSFAFPFLERWQHLPQSGLEFPFFRNIIFYPLLGYYCEKKELLAKGKSVVAALAFSLFVTIVNLVLLEKGKTLFEDFNVFLYAVTTYVTVKYVFQRWECPKQLERFWLFCGAGVFGTYLLDAVLRSFCEPVYQGMLFLGRIPAVYLWILSVMAVGICLVNAVKKCLHFLVNRIKM